MATGRAGAMSTRDAGADFPNRAQCAYEQTKRPPLACAATNNNAPSFEMFQCLKPLEICLLTGTVVRRRICLPASANVMLEI
jgi:hypothetical protein